MAKYSAASQRSSIANRLWTYRRRMGFTQRQVAQIIGYGSATDISHYERGDKAPDLVTALKLEIVYRVPVAFLFPELYGRLKTTLRDREEKLRIVWAEVRKER